MKLTRFMLLALFPLLSACYQTQLVGNTGETTVSVAELRTGTEVSPAFESWGPTAWIDIIEQEAWDSYGPILQLVLVGMAIPSLDNVEENELYLISAAGGSDYDANADLTLDSNPTAVQGQWHAVVSGERLLKGDIQVSALTEAAYQLVRKNMDLYEDAILLQQLDAAARLLVVDVDGNDLVDYDDILAWNRGLDSAKYVGELSHLDTLATAIINGQPDESLAAHAETAFGNDRVTLTSNFGIIEMETLNWDAPISAANFLSYVNAGYYNNVIFHRTIDDFMIQTGWLELVGENTVNAKTPNDPIFNESRNGVANDRGTVAMARTSSPHSASAQFFINQKNPNNSFLNYDFDDEEEGYAVFARVLSGMEIVDEIAGLPTSRVNGIGNDVPNEIVLIESLQTTE